MPLPCAKWHPGRQETLLKTYWCYFFISESLKKPKDIFDGMGNLNKKVAYYPRSTKKSDTNKVTQRSESERQKSLLHPIYIFPKTENDKEIIFKFSQTLKRSKVYYIQSIGNSLESFKNAIEDEEKEFIYDNRCSAQNDNKPFMTLLNKSIKHIKPDQARKWKLKVNGSFCQMLVLKNNCAKPNSAIGSLRKKLGEIIENETIQHIIKFWDMPCTNDQLENTTPKLAKRKLENKSIGEKSKKPKLEKEKTHDTQKSIAEELYRRIKAKLKQFDNIDLEKEFEDFKFIILLPNRLSLEEQTIERIQEKFGSKTNSEKNVIRICPGSKDLQKKWEKFIQSARTTPKTFFLVIHDECHSAAGTNGTFKFLYFGQGDYHYQKEMLLEKLLPNLFTVMVSATPYNFFAHLNPEDILYWNQHLKETRLPNTYQGLTDFRKGTENCKMLSTTSEMSSWWEKNQESFSPMNQNGFSKEFILVLLDYCTAISDCANQDQAVKWVSSFPSTPEVNNCVEQCLHQNKQIIVRLVAAFDEINSTEVSQIVLQKVIAFFKQEIEIVVQTSIQHTNKKPEAALESTSKIIIVIDQYRMGDTFPKSCICFDLRARYLNPITDFTLIIQDVGRAFGYGKRPLLLLSQKANNFLTDIWDSHTGYISWDSLLKNDEMKNVLLGQNIIRPSTSHKIDEEVDSTEMVIKQFKKMYAHDPQNPVFLFMKSTEKSSAPKSVKESAKQIRAKTLKHRIFLKADPQNGKTGAFLHLAFLLEKELGSDAFTVRKMSTQVYVDKNLPLIKGHFNTPGGMKEHDVYLKALKKTRAQRKKDGIVEPSKWAALCLIKNLLENSQQNSAEIQIADFGCGDMQFANFFCEELQKKLQEKPELAQTKFAIQAFDLSPNEIPVSEQLKSSQQISIVSCPGVSCGDATQFVGKCYDFIVSTMALFGNGDSWKETIRNAFNVLKTDGLFFLAESKKNLPSDIAQNLATAGIDCRHIVPGILLK
jgi:hypothetical protein